MTDPILTELAQRYPDLAPCLDDLHAAFLLLRDSYRAGGKVLVCGNGGSAADSQHWVGELMKGFEHPRPLDAALRQRLEDFDPQHGPLLAAQLQGALPSLALSGQISLESAFSNDAAPQMVFAQQVLGLGRAGDVLVAISTSGNSANVLHALRVAKVLGLHTLGLTGQSGGAMAADSPRLCEVLIRVPYTRTRDVQERHLPVYHALSLMLEREFFA